MQCPQMCGIVVHAVAVIMCLVKYHGLILCLLFFHTEALNCRSEGGPKESELKTIYRKCLKMQDGKNFSSSRDYGDQEWKDQGHHRQNTDWDRDQMSSNERGRSREERSGSRSDRRSSTDDRMGSYDQRGSNSDSYGENSGSYGDRMRSSDRMGSFDGRMGSSNNRMGRYGSDRDDSMNNRDSGYDRDHSYSGRNDFQHDDYGSDMSNQYGYQSSTQSSRRYKREKHSENSGQRSQFNPNSSKKSSNYDDSYQSDDKNSKKNNTSKDDDKKACALHCFLENLEMTAEDGMPDRYLVTHTLTKDVNNEDLKDFLQESIEECFQILNNENTEEKCEFSKNLLMCLSEKGRANCDDWKDDLRF